jgi:hypothetical protein
MFLSTFWSDATIKGKRSWGFHFQPMMKKEGEGKMMKGIT